MPFAEIGNVEREARMLDSDNTDVKFLDRPDGLGGQRQFDMVDLSVRAADVGVSVVVGPELEDCRDTSVHRNREPGALFVAHAGDRLT